MSPRRARNSEGDGVIEAPTKLTMVTARAAEVLRLSYSRRKILSTRVFAAG